MILIILISVLKNGDPIDLCFFCIGIGEMLDLSHMESEVKIIEVNLLGMAKGDMKPFMIGVERTTQHLLSCIEKKPIRYTAPWIVIPLVKFRRWMLRFKTL